MYGSLGKPLKKADKWFDHLLPHLRYPRPVIFPVVVSLYLYILSRFVQLQCHLYLQWYAWVRFVEESLEDLQLWCVENHLLAKLEHSKEREQNLIALYIRLLWTTKLLPYAGVQWLYACLYLGICQQKKPHLESHKYHTWALSVVIINFKCNLSIGGW